MPDLGMFAGDGVGVDSSPTYYCKRPHEFVAADSSEIMCGPLPGRYPRFFIGGSRLGLGHFLIPAMEP